MEPQESSENRAKSSADLPEHLLLYDGVCGFCDGAVRRLTARDRERRIRYAPLQGETAAALRSRHPELPDDVDSIVYVHTDAEGRETLKWYSEASFALARLLPAPWRWLGLLRFLPRSLTDWGYRRFAGIRYRLFGKLDACRIPDEDERALFLP